MCSASMPTHAQLVRNVRDEVAAHRLQARALRNVARKHQPLRVDIGNELHRKNEAVPRRFQLQRLGELAGRDVRDEFRLAHEIGDRVADIGFGADAEMRFAGIVAPDDAVFGVQDRDAVRKRPAGLAGPSECASWRLRAVSARCRRYSSVNTSSQAPLPSGTASVSAPEAHWRSRRRCRRWWTRSPISPNENNDHPQTAPKRRPVPNPRTARRRTTTAVRIRILLIYGYPTRTKSHTTATLIRLTNTAALPISFARFARR